MIATPPSLPRPIVWTDLAVDDLEAIQTYIATMNPRAAERVAKALLEAGESLSTYPMRGRPSGGARQFVAVAPYVIRYRVRPNEVIILRVRHGRRQRV